MLEINSQKINTTSVMAQQNEKVSNTTTTSDVLSTNASKMLEAALQQMDGIISGNSNLNDSADGIKSLVKPSTIIKAERSLISVNNVLSTAKTLALALQQDWLHLCQIQLQ
uniref:Uncharacterized protein n=1 Tax=Bactrocera dorsalis TaxID=27457 RepID=A0A034VUL7_BACDO